MKRSMQATVMTMAAVLGLAISLNAVEADAKPSKPVGKFLMDQNGDAYMTLDSGIVGGWLQVVDQANKSGTPLMQAGGATRGFTLGKAKAPKAIPTEDSEVAQTNAATASQFVVKMAAVNEADKAAEAQKTYLSAMTMLNAAVGKSVNGCWTEAETVNNSIAATSSPKRASVFSFIGVPVRALAPGEKCTTARILEPRTKFFGPFSVE